VYYERLGGIDVEALKREGVEPKALLWHYMYQVYLYIIILHMHAHIHCTAYYTSEVYTTDSVYGHANYLITNK
jgi:hypothetical protein